MLEHIFRKQTDASVVADFISGRLLERLRAGQKVLWLVPGGSSIAVAALVSQQLVGVNLSNLIVGLTDERYGDVGHADSNWLQLEAAGFNLPGAQKIMVLSGDDMPATVRQFDADLKEALATTSYKLGFFGIGKDGHVAGILPHSSALDDPNLVHGYDGGQFQRITLTPLAIEQLDEAVVYMSGQEKVPQIERLVTTQLVQDQPAQILKKLDYLTIFNDYKEGSF